MNTTSLDTRYFTETELTNGALDGRYYTETEAEARFLRQDSSETIASGVSWSNSDAFVATTAAINARIVDLIDEVGGFTAIANETSFPTTNPQGATGQSAILSVAAASTTLTPSGTTLTIANGCRVRKHSDCNRCTYSNTTKLWFLSRIYIYNTYIHFP